MTDLSVTKSDIDREAVFLIIATELALNLDVLQFQSEHLWIVRWFLLESY